MYGCQIWTIMKAEHWRVDAFEQWCWRRLPWTARRSKQSILKEIKPEYSLEGLMLKLKLQHFGHLMRRTDSLEKTLMMGKIKGRRRKEPQRMKWLDCFTDSMDMSLSELWEMVKDREAWRAAVHGIAELYMPEWLNNILHGWRSIRCKVYRIVLESLEKHFQNAISAEGSEYIYYIRVGWGGVFQ